MRRRPNAIRMAVAAFGAVAGLALLPSTASAQQQQGEPAGLHDGPRNDWLDLDGPDGSHAMLGAQGIGIIAFVADRYDRGHFVSLTFKGDCHQGWMLLPTAGRLDTMALQGTGGGATTIQAPAIPWLQAALVRTCSNDRQTEALTNNEAMWRMMNPR